MAEQGTTERAEVVEVAQQLLPCTNYHIPVPWDPVPPSALHGHPNARRAHKCMQAHTHTYKQVFF